MACSAAKVLAFLASLCRLQARDRRREKWLGLGFRAFEIMQGPYIKIRIRLEGRIYCNVHPDCT